MNRLAFDLNHQSVILEYHRPRVGPEITAAFVDGLRRAQQQLTKAVNNVALARIRLGVSGTTSLSDDFRDLLRASFMLPATTAPDAATTYSEALKRIHECVLQIRDAANADVLEIRELEGGLPEWVKGYVPTTLTENLVAMVRARSHDFSTATPLQAPLQLKIDIPADDIAWYWIHEASHKFALTADIKAGGEAAYFKTSNKAADLKGLRQVATELEKLERSQGGIEARLLSFQRQDPVFRLLLSMRSTDLLDNADSYSHFVIYQPDAIR
jgi:hypothetical protein